MLWLTRVPNKMAPKKKFSSTRPAKPKNPPPLPPILTDAQSIEARQRSALEENAAVMPVQLFDEFHGDYEVDSTQWDTPYRVEMRDLQGCTNSCGCMDFQMNRLGTCKHIERVRQLLPHRRKVKFRAAAAAGSPVVEIFADTTLHPVRLRCVQPQKVPRKLLAALEPYFDAEGLSFGPLPEVFAALSDTVASLPAALRRQIRISRHIAVWADRAAQRAEQERLHRTFDAEVAAGKRGDNPVNLPLYPYQKQGMRHLAFLGRALLADEMGLGKTVQAIAAAELLRKLGRVRRVLVVTPASLKGEWADQLQTFTGKQAQLLYGPRQERMEVYAQPIEFLLANYEQVRTDVDEINARYTPDLVILDEAQRIKNWPTKTAKTIKRLQSPYAFVLTGTPLENRVQELYSLCEFVDPLLFGTLDRFHREFMKVQEDNGMLMPRDLPALHRRVSKVMLRRRKAEVECDLPAREDKMYQVGMTEEQALRYGDTEYQLQVLLKRIEGRKPTKEEFERIQMLLSCMRMLCDTPYILDETCKDCPKLEELTEILEELIDEPNAKILIFSEWVRMLHLVKERLRRLDIGYAEHTGKIPQQKRREELKKFKKDPECQVLLCSESGGVGLNLQAANTVINLDLPWNPAKLEQRIARAWRKNQQRTVRVLNLVTTNSIEENMIGKLAAKTALADAVLDGAETSFDPNAARASFINQLRETMGALDDPEHVPLHRASKRKEASAPEPTLSDLLVGRHSDRIRSVEQAPNGAAVVVAEPGPGLRDLQQTATKLGGVHTRVISTETLAAIRELQKIGVLQVLVPLETTYAVPGAAPLTEIPDTPPAPPRYPEPSRAHWQTADRERKAAAALAGLGLTEQALPHLQTVLTTAAESLQIYFSGKTEAPEASAALSEAEAKLLEQICSAPAASPSDPNLAARLFEEVDHLLGTA